MLDMIGGLPDGIYAEVMSPYWKLKDGIEVVRKDEYLWKISKGGDSFYISSPKVTWEPFAFDVSWWEIDANVKSKYERLLPVEKGDSVVDVGACFGSFSVSVSERADEFLSIEPNRRAIPSLVKNTEGFGDKIIIRDCAVSRENKKVELNVSNSPTCSSLDAPRSVCHSETVRGFTLDSLIKRSIGYADFVKLNAEGYEKEIIEGIKDFSCFDNLVVATHRGHGLENYDMMTPDKIKPSWIDIWDILESEGFDLKVSCHDLLFASKSGRLTGCGMYE